MRKTTWWMAAAPAAEMLPRPAHAHVTWFAEFSFADRPLTVGQAAIGFHRRPGLRTAFAAVNFALLLAILLPLYAAAARAPASDPAAIHARADRSPRRDP